MRRDRLTAAVLVACAVVAVPACRRRPAIEKVPDSAYTGPTYSPPAPSVTPHVLGSAAPSKGCVHGWAEPKPGSPAYTTPLDLLRRTQDGMTGTFTVVDLRYFTDARNRPWWYGQVVHATDKSFALRFLVSGSNVVAVANYITEDFVSPDWSGFRGTGGSSAYPNVPGKWPGRPYDYAKDGDLPVDVIGCLATTP
jgi:hypothetical protein